VIRRHRHQLGHRTGERPRESVPDQFHGAVAESRSATAGARSVAVRTPEPDQAELTDRRWCIDSIARSATAELLWRTASASPPLLLSHKEYADSSRIGRQTTPF